MKNKLLLVMVLIVVACSACFVATGCKDKHEHAYTVETVEPTCTDDGKKVHTCSCGDTYTTDVVNKLGHSFGDYQSDNNARCEIDATETARCARSGCSATTSRAIANTATGHNYDLGHTVDSLPTCDKDGIKSRHCLNNCGSSIDHISIPSTGHNIVNGECDKCGGKFATPGLTYALNNTGTEYTVTGAGQFNGSELYIPEVYENRPVTGIGYGAFNQNTKLTKIYIPKSIKYIANLAFNGCVNVSEVIYDAEAVTNLTTENNVFAYLGQSTNGIKVIFGANVKTVPDNLFYASTMPNTSPKITNINFTANATATHIGVNAFANTTALKTASLPESLTSIGYGVFAGCTMLQSLEIPFVGSKASYNPDADGEDIVENYFTWLFASEMSLDGALGGMGSLIPGLGDSMVVPNNAPATLKTVKVTTHNIPEAGFSIGCDLIETITLVNQTKINARTFANCASLVNIELPDSIEAIEKSAFANCISLTGVKIPSKVTVIAESLFSGCTSLTDLSITPTIKEIGNYAYEYCTALREIVIPNTVNKIGAEMFKGCLYITKVTVPFIGATKDASTASQTSVFGHIFSLNNTEYKSGDDEYTVYNTYKAIQSYSSSGTTERYIPKTLREVVINGGNISYGAFSELMYIQKITFNGATTIGVDAFRNCYALADIIVEGANDSYKSIDGNLYNKDATTLILYGIGKTNSSFVIPDSVTTIGKYAFKYALNLQSITIPAGIKTISEGAFYECKALTEINYNATKCSNLSSYSYAFYKAGQKGDGITVNVGEGVEEMPYYLFYDSNAENTPKITVINISSTVTKISTYSFYNLTLLEEINYNAKSCTNFASGSPFYNAGQAGDGITVNIGAKVTKLPEYFLSTSSSSTAPKVIAVNFASGSQLKEVGDYAFRYCDELSFISIPNSVTTIGVSAFSDCSNLARIDIPTTVEVIEYYAFYNCVGLTSFDIPTSIDSLSSVFVGCTGLTSITIPANVTSLDGTFLNCTNLQTVSLPTTLTKIGSSTFNGCSKLASIQIPANVEEIGSDAFEDCIKITEIYIPAKVAKLGSSAFARCTSLETIAFATGVSITEIAQETFDGCTVLTNVVLPNTVTSIGDNAFRNCIWLNTIAIPDAIEYVSETAFKDAMINQSLTDYENAFYIGNENNKYLILKSAFDSTKTTCTIHENTKIIMTDAFDGCTNLTRVDYAGTIEQWMNIDFASEKSNPLYYAKKLYINNTLVTNLELPSVTEVGDYVFCGASIASLNIPNTVTTIGVGAFANCTNLAVLSFPASVTSIKKNAFNGCTSLQNVVVPNTVTVIEEGAFGGCTKLKSISLPFVGRSANATDELGVFGYIFGYSTSASSGGTHQYSSYTGGVGETRYYYYIPASLTTVVITGGTQIPNNAFNNCENLTSITLPNTIKTIGASAFRRCLKLATITIPESVEKINDNAFYNCSSLTEITIPSSVTRIGYQAFYYCSNLTSVKFSNPSGWWVNTSSYATSGSSISGLSTVTTAASYLRGQYASYYWNRG